MVVKAKASCSAQFIKQDKELKLREQEKRVIAC